MYKCCFMIPYCILDIVTITLGVMFIYLQYPKHPVLAGQDGHNAAHRLHR